MNYVNVRNSLGLSQAEMANLFGIPVTSIKNWEQGAYRPGGVIHTIYSLLEDKSRNQDLITHLVSVACAKKYEKLGEALTTLELIHKMIKNDLIQALLQIMLVESNSHWGPGQFGFKVTEILVAM